MFFCLFFVLFLFGLPLFIINTNIKKRRKEKKEGKKKEMMRTPTKIPSSRQYNTAWLETYQFPSNSHLLPSSSDDRHIRRPAQSNLAGI
jgi:hypothetical protein